MVERSDFQRLSTTIQAELESQSFLKHATDFDRRPLIQIANRIGGPPMLLLHWKRLLELQRIPHFDESEAVDAMTGINSFGAGRVEIIMVSHRWLRPSENRLQAFPDEDDHPKAKAINEFSDWRRQWVLARHGFLPEIFYWIDYSCIDQRDTAAAVPLLPLWVASCERFLRVETEDYDARAWCRLEALLSYVYSFADHHLSIDLDFRCRWPDTGYPTRLPILDPNAALTTNPSDMAMISNLVAMATKTIPTNQHQSHVQLGQTTVTCFKL